MSQEFFSTDLPGVKPVRCGKVRDIYSLGEHLLIVATDRISAFDVVLPNCIPHKGRVLTKLSEFWFGYLGDITKNHLVTTDLSGVSDSLIQAEYKAQLTGRSMLVKRAEPFPVECVVRGYLAGSGWMNYSKGKPVSGIKLRSGYRQSDKLDEPIFTPSTKADSGHDIEISVAEMENIIGKEKSEVLVNKSISLYLKAAQRAEKRGIIIADTKFEFGLADNEIILIDEALTPDSSRFWPKNEYLPGKSQASFDKQFVLDYLSGLNWDKTPPAPVLPYEIIQKTSQKYLQALKLLT